MIHVPDDVLHSFSKYISSVVMVTAEPMTSLLSAISNESSSGTCVPHIITLDCSPPVLRASPVCKKKQHYLGTLNETAKQR